jgi:glucose/arabinose dehydrogenase
MAEVRKRAGDCIASVIHLAASGIKTVILRLADVYDEDYRAATTRITALPSSLSRSRVSSHVAPLGMAFYTDTNLPETYRGGAFVGEHGSWNRHEFNGCKVIFVPFRDGHPNGMPQDAVTGFLNGDNEARGRPVGLAVDKAGALLVADDVGNTVWRVTSSTR